LFDLVCVGAEEVGAGGGAGSGRVSDGLVCSQARCKLGALRVIASSNFSS
jgi:hypothetical protein